MVERKKTALNKDIDVGNIIADRFISDTNSITLDVSRHSITLDVSRHGMSLSQPLRIYNSHFPYSMFVN